MSDLKRAGRFLSVAALAASTALSGPLAALAQTPPPPVEQEASPEPEQAPPPVEDLPAPPAEEPAAPPEAPAPEAPVEEPPPTEIQPPEPEPEPDPAPQPATPEPPRPGGPSTPSTPAAPDSGPPTDAPQGDPSELPIDEGTQNDAGTAPNPPAPTEGAPASADETPAPTPSEPPAATDTAEPAAPAAPTPPEPTETESGAPAPAAPSAEPVPPAPPAPGTEPTTPATDPAARAAPDAAPTAPTQPGTPPTAPNAAPIVPGTPPAPAAPPAPDGVAPAAPPATPGGAPPATAPAEPAAPPAAAPGQAPSPEAAAPAAPPVEAPQPVPVDIQTAPVPEGGVGQSDARVQQLQQPIVVPPVREVQGQPLQAAPSIALPPNVEVVERVGNRDVLSLVGAGIAGAAAGGLAAYFIRSDDNERLSRGSDEVRFEELPRGLTRQTIRRPNGEEIVSIENEYGDVIQRSKILPDGREIVLFYDPYAEDADRPDYYYDAGADLPPVRLTIPRERYIVDIDQPDEDLYYETIVAPPVETVERIYSVDEVRRSPRIRDKVRRIDLNTINFAFGSADIEQDEVRNLQALADAVKRVIDENPGEVFLLEGHTDAVGSNVANLALSDRRAESVASALSSYFEIPAENLVTQGYGEENLKVNTQEPNRENRRVTLRRITSLVKPVESAGR